MAVKVFVSFRYSDANLAKSVKSFFGQGVPGSPVFIDQKVSAQSRETIDAEIKQVMAGCAAVLFVIGSNSHNSPWIAREVELAQSMGIPRIAVQMGMAKVALPPALANEGLKLLPWSPAAIGSRLTQVLQKRG